MPSPLNSDENLTQEQIDFIEKFKSNSGLSDDSGDKPVAAGNSLGKFAKVLFNLTIVTLLIIPVILSGIFLSTINQYERVVNEKSETVLGGQITMEELSEITKSLGYSDFDSLIFLYQNRYEIVAGIFIIFIAAIIVMFLLRLIISMTLTNRRGQNAR